MQIGVTQVTNTVHVIWSVDNSESSFLEHLETMFSQLKPCPVVSSWTLSIISHSLLQDW